MKKKIDSKIKALIENAAKFRHRCLFIIVGDRGCNQVVNLHYMMATASVRKKPSVLWCYKKELGFSSHKKKRMKRIKKMISKGLYDKDVDDPFELFITKQQNSSNNLSNCTQDILFDLNMIMPKLFDIKLKI